MGNATELMTHDPSVRFADEARDMTHVPSPNLSRSRRDPLSFAGEGTSPASLGRDGYFSFSPLPG